MSAMRENSEMKLLIAIPCRRLDAAKSRLSGVLSPAERRCLAEAMLRDVLAAVSAAKTGASKAVVTSDCEIREIAQGYGIDTIPLERDDGLVPACEAARVRAGELGADALMILPADLPCVAPHDIDAAVRLHGPSPAVTLSGAARDGGTNLLIASPPGLIAFRYGPGSLAKHVAEAEAAGASLHLIDNGRLAMDIDTPADLAALDPVQAGSETRKVRDETGPVAKAYPADGTDAPGGTPATRRSIDRVRSGAFADEDALALALADAGDTGLLIEAASERRDRAHGRRVSFSKKVFIPLTFLCRDVCRYCTFAKSPRQAGQPYLTRDDVLRIAEAGDRAGCHEGLFTLGDRPEARYAAAREALAGFGHDSTISYLAEMAGAVLKGSGLLPHVNPGVMTREEIEALRRVSVSQGTMLESTAARLCAPGGPHHGCPDKAPAVRLATLEDAGRAAVPFTTGILIGIGETRAERIDALLRIRETHARHGHIQEVIVQNFVAKPGTGMASIPDAALDDLLWTIAVARLILPAEMNIQAPPNLAPGNAHRLIEAGINDFGGVSPVTIDHVNPESPWPEIDALADTAARAGASLVERLAIYPSWLAEGERWLDPALLPRALRVSDAEGYARTDGWTAGRPGAAPDMSIPHVASGARHAVAAAIDRATAGHRLDVGEIETLFAARDEDFAAVTAAADALRKVTCGNAVSYVVTRNINYTNVCGFGCRFCAFSKGKTDEALRGKPYVLTAEEIARRVSEAWDRGGTEVCLQGGIHPEFTGETYLTILRTVHDAVPGMHAHAFSPLEISQGARTLGLPVREFLERLRDAGLGSLPGTAAEILDDEVRAVLCPDKLSTDEWLDVVRTAHEVGLHSTATIMYGHVDRPIHWARHLLHIRDLQAETGGFTEFVPLPFVHMESPVYLKSRARPGPTYREAVLMHAVARLVLHGLVSNIQTSWVKMGPDGAAHCLNAGANDLGGTLMNESITRAAGASYGEELSPEGMERIIRGIGRTPRQRTTLYADAPADRVSASFGTAPLAPTVQTPAREFGGILAGIPAE